MDKNRTNRNGGKRNRRNFLGLAGGVVAGGLLATPVSADESPRSNDPFDPNDDSEVSSFIDDYLSTASKKRRKQMSDSLSEKQFDAFYRVHQENLTFEWSRTELPSSANEEIYVPEGESGSDEITIQIDRRYADSVDAYSSGSRLYTWEHEIAYSYGSNRVRYRRSAARGQAYKAGVSYDGLSGYKDVRYFGQNTTVRVELEGVFSDTNILNYKPRIQLQADATGQTSTPSKDSGFPP